MSTDIKIPKDLQDGCYVISTHKIRELTAYLFQPEICPLSDEIKKQIEPKRVGSAETQRCFGMFTALYKSQTAYFQSMPIFTLLYSSRCLLNRDLLVSSIEFITNFLKPLEKDRLPNENILDILIPFAIYKPFVEDTKPPVILPFILFLCKKFGTKIFMNHLMTILEGMTKNSDIKYQIGHFHIDLLLAIVEGFELSQEEIDRIDNNILVTVKKNDQIPMKQSVAALIQLINNTPHRRQSAANSPQRAPPQPQHDLDFSKLESYLDEIESHLYASAPSVLSNIRIELDRLDAWPEERSCRPLFFLCLYSYPGNTDLHRSNIFSIISFMNKKITEIDAELLLTLYLEAAYDKKVNLEFADRCYQEFRFISQLPDAPITLKNNPKRLTSRLSDDKNNAQFMLLKLAFDSLKNWDTAYDGVQKIWTAITKNPDIDLSEYICDLEYSQKSYLLQGLRAIQDYDEPIMGTKEAIRRIEDYLIEHDNFSVTSARSRRSARASPAKRNTPKGKTVSKMYSNH